MSNVRIQAYDETNKIFRNVECNADGELITSTTLDTSTLAQKNQFPLSLGQTNKAGSTSVVLASDSDNLGVSLDSIDVSVKGQTTMSASLPVAIASDQSSLAVKHDGVDTSQFPVNVKAVDSSLEFPVKAVLVGSHGNIASSTSISATSSTTAVNIELKEANLHYIDSSTAENSPIYVEVSADNSNFIRWYKLTPTTGTDNEFLSSSREAVAHLNLAGWKYIRIYNANGSQAVTATCTLVGCN